MTRTIRALAATTATAALALGLAAPVAAAEPSWSRKDRVYVRTIKADAPELRPISTRMLVKMAHLTCDVLRQGVDPLDLVHEAVDAGFHIDTGIVIVASAAAFYCPDTEYLFSEWVQA